LIEGAVVNFSVGQIAEPTKFILAYFITQISLSPHPFLRNNVITKLLARKSATSVLCHLHDLMHCMMHQFIKAFVKLILKTQLTVPRQ
jgi:hypothetical protein